MSVLHVRHLYHRYGLDDVLADVGLDLEAGETVAIVGPSGCGKSTLLQVLAGLLVPNEILLHSEFRGLSYVFQQPRLMPWKTALNNIALPLKALRVPKNARIRLASALAARMGLSSEDLTKYPHELSGGMQSRISLARALISKPDLLLLDEPFSALDIGLKAELYAMLREQVQQYGTAVLMITHDVMEAVRLADRILLMVPEPGRIIHEFTLTKAHAQRDDFWLYQTTAELLQVEQVRIAFGLAAGTLPDFVASNTHANGCAL